LGPLLFLLYINDFPQYILDTKVVLFTDDINIVLADKDVTRLQEKVNNTMKQIESWFSDNKMIINVNKSKAIFFHLKNKNVEENPHIIFKNEKIGYISALKFLGIHVSDSFSWRMQIQTLCTNLSKVCYIVKMLKNKVSFYVLRNIYFAKFQSLMRYGIILWGGTSETTKLLKLQERVLRLMTNKYKTIM
jgi:hypothetical protein